LQQAPTVVDLPCLPYTLQVFKEALRLYPPIYGIFRQVRQPVQLGPYHLKPGTRLGISPSTLHRNPHYFPDPERFDPDRWTPEQEAALPRYAYLPFGAGPHRCIGHHFAMLEAHPILATLAQRVTFELVPGQLIVPEPLITLRPKGGLRVMVRRR
jgi:cytochrome P450